MEKPPTRIGAIRTSSLIAVLLWSGAGMTSFAAQSPPFDPIAFFKGRTHGDGTLKIVLQSPKRVRVDSIGRVERDGSLTLSQRIEEQGKAPRTRTWRLRQTAPGKFAGSLSDAKGPVTVDVIGGRTRIRYTDKDNLKFEQWLTPRGPRQVENRLTVKRLGITVAHLDETIRKLD